MTLRSLLLTGWMGVPVLIQSGCATILLSNKISKDHRYVYYHHQDEDRVDRVDAAVMGEDGAVQILYTGSHGPGYVTQSYRMTLPAKKMSKVKTQIVANENTQEIQTLPIPMKRSATRRSDHLASDGEWKELPLHSVNRIHDLDLVEMRRRAQQKNESVVILYSPFLRHLTIPPGSTSLKTTGTSTGIGILYVGNDPEEMTVLMVPYVPLKETHDFSGLGYRTLYPLAIAWDVVSFPVQAVVGLWVFTSSSGGWLF